MKPHRTISRCVATTLGVGLAIALVGPVVGNVIYSTGFEDPPFANDSVLVGQEGWVGVPLLSPNSAVVAAGINAGGSQALRVRGLDLETQPDLNTLTGGYYEAIGSFRRPVNYETNGSRTVRVSADVLLSGVQTAAENNFFSAAVGSRTRLTDGSTAGTGELAISSDGNVYGYCGCENVPTFLTSTPITLNAWHNLSLDVNPGAHSLVFRGRHVVGYF